jgi:hypothetical protein
MIKLIRRQALLLILASMLIATLGAFNSSTFAEGEIVIEGGSYSCPAPAGCGNWGCHAKSIADPTQVCSLYKITGPNDCTGSVTCDLVP